MQHFNAKLFKLLFEKLDFLKCGKQFNLKLCSIKFHLFRKAVNLWEKKCVFCHNNQSFRYLNVINSSCEQSSCQRQDINKVPRAEPSVNITSLLRITNHSKWAIRPKSYFIISATFCLLKHIIMTYHIIELKNILDVQ